MDDKAFQVFRFEISRQCQFADIAWKYISLALRSNDINLLWYSIQSFLGAAANISKILWPSAKQREMRGAELRSQLRVPDGAPLEYRGIRNHFEHFDERLDSWASSPEPGLFVDSNVGPKGAIAGIDPKDFLRNFDPASYVVSFRDEEYPLRPIEEAIKHLRAAAEKE